MDQKDLKQSCPQKYEGANPYLIQVGHYIVAAFPQAGFAQTKMSSTFWGACSDFYFWFSAVLSISKQGFIVDWG